MLRESSILPIWKPVGFSTHIIAKKVAELNGLKTSHTGTLDPMAEGVIIVLLGEERFKKYEYANWAKTYKFQIVLGIQTDSLDGLGLPVFGDLMNLERFQNIKDVDAMLLEVLPKFIGNYVQQVPPYSTKKINGKPLHWYARNNRLENVTLPMIEGQLYALEKLSIATTTISELATQITDKIALVTGDLRQQEITQAWQAFARNNPAISLPAIDIVTTLSKGLYVRRLAADIAHSLDTCGFVANLVRTKNGDFDATNSFSLGEIFGENFAQKYNFDSSQNYENKLN